MLKLELFARAAALLSIAVGSIVLAGWVVDTDALKGAVGSPITMKANTALAFIVTGISLWLSLDPANRWANLRSMMAVLAAMIGGLTFVEHLIGWDFGIDQLLFSEPAGEPATASPGRMGPPASLSFLCVGLGLLLLDQRAGDHYPFRYLPLIATTISLVPVVGYAYGSVQLYSAAAVTGIAWPTAVTMLLLSAGALAARPHNAVVRVLAAANAGGLATRRMIGPALLIPFGLVLVYGIARDAEFVDAQTARAILSVTMMLALTAMVLVTAYRLAVTAEKHAQAEADLRKSSQELADFFEDAVVGLHCVNEDGIIVRANKAEIEMLGYAGEEYVGHHIAEFHADPAVVTDLLDRLKDDETVRDYPARLRCKDGSIKDVLIDSSVLWEGDRFVHTRCFTRDMTQQWQADLESRRLSAIVESSNDAIISKNLDGIVTSWNGAAERMYGYSAAEMVGQSITKIIPRDRESEECEILDRIRRGKKVELFESVRRHKNGKLIEVSLSISPILDRSGQVTGASKIARDITERKQIEGEREALLKSEREARSIAERAARSRDEFLALVSHELRTPLNGMLGWAQYLKSQPLDTSVAEGIDAIERGARTQATLIEDLLDMNRIASGRIALEIATVDLLTVIEAAIATVRPAAKSKQIELRLVPDSTRRFVTGDATRLQQVFWNLLSNAVKFTPNGGSIEVILRQNDSHAEVTVKDTGMGIAPEFLPYVFERFRQADGSTSRAHGGLGLGLSIAKNLVELHGGTVRAESAGMGRGAELVVLLPLAHVPTASSSARHSMAADVPVCGGIDLAGVKVLVVEDDGESRMVIERILSHAHAIVRTVGSGAEALAILATEKTDVLISDIGMPQMDGYEFIRIVREDLHLSASALPAVALTAYARWEDRTRAMLAGFQTHVAKPVEPQELLATIANFADRQSAAITW